MNDAHHPLQCRCGRVKGHVVNLSEANRIVCYCKDCQAFAHFLGRGADVLDPSGGTDVVQTLPRNVVFMSGRDALACMRLTEKGLLRWYASCCKTPIGNTADNFKLSFIGLIHSCLDEGDRSVDQSFGPARVRVHTNSARHDPRGNPKPRSQGTFIAVLKIVRGLIKARLNGSYKDTPFFEHGTPIVKPKVLSESERAAVMSLL
jgi:hypothetical protein